MAAAETNSKPQEASSMNESVATEESSIIKSIKLTDKMTGGDKDVDVFIRNVWTYIIDISEEKPPIYDAKPLLSILKKAERVLEDEETVLDLQGPLTIIGDIQGHADSLVTLLSLTSQSSNQRFLFLGNYSGCGFAPHETLFLLLALKVRYPQKIFLLKGNLEDPENAKAHFFIEGLALRNLMNTVLVWLTCERIFDLLPLAAIVAGRLFCVHGGIGEYTLNHGISAIRNIQRPPLMPLELAITKELIWGCFGFGADKTMPSKDNVPLFNEQDVEGFCKRNSIDMIIRSRQLANEGVLNVPRRMITIWSAVSFLDNFNNMAAALVLDTQCVNATVVSYSLYEPEPKSLDDTKPPGGRSTLAVS